MADCAPRFNATPGRNGYFSVFPNASFVTLVWDYNPDVETVKYVELYTQYRYKYLLVARKPPSQPLQVFENSSYSGRVTFSGRPHSPYQTLLKVTTMITTLNAEFLSTHTSTGGGTVGKAPFTLL